ncbi:ribosomal protein S7 [Aureobasidium pullulans EXF-150]|uniref:Ribosomal protein S7 n=1 Tax=Aureobasidium pullulans EXF-150 TaxID=1043002 RepID=A0A074X3N9_AURPU|nr:ribosomal protein S7 [Aureobasidium pullulans EXF-150]KEQ78399.1 ribosomal protein S7 [Aureobasidium pullulans EXF-150]
MNGRNNGKKLIAVRIVAYASEIVAVDAIVNCGPREDSTDIGSAGTATFRNIKSVAERLAKELINAGKGSSNSYATKKKDELERVAKSNG